jgi:hypothetical protein
MTYYGRLLITFLTAVAVATITLVFGAASPASADQICSNKAIASRASGLYVSAELSWTGDNYGILRARASSVGPWEQFRFASDPTWSGSHFNSLANGRYVSTEIGWTGNSYAILRARAVSVGPWEIYSSAGA